MRRLLESCLRTEGQHLVSFRLPLTSPNSAAAKLTPNGRSVISAAQNRPRPLANWWPGGSAVLMAARDPLIQKLGLPAHGGGLAMSGVDTCVGGEGKYALSDGSDDRWEV